jgi:molybdopterin synthase sulfur carrier subunit
MTVVKLYGNLRDFVAAPVTDVTGDTVRAVLMALSVENDALRDAIFNGDVLLPHVRVMIDGRDIELAEGLDTPLQGAEQIAIFPPIAGGYK